MQTCRTVRRPTFLRRRACCASVNSWIDEVSYSIFSLGRVKLEILNTVQRNGVTVFRAKAHMDSYSGVPFVNLHWIFYSEIDPQLFSHFFSGVDNKDSTNASYSNYSFDYERNRVLVERGARQQLDSTERSTDTISDPRIRMGCLCFITRAGMSPLGRCPKCADLCERKESQHLHQLPE